MVRIVLSEMERDGTFTPALAVTTGDETEALTCTIQGVVRNLTAYANRLGSVGKLSNRIDISQAMGGVPQAINFDFDLIDWDGFSRVSVAMLEGTARFVGWEVSVIVDSAPPVSLAVQNASANGDTISFHCVSRFELTSRPCAFGAGAQQVGLVVGGHDVSVETQGLAEPVPLEYTGADLSSYEAREYVGNPSAATLFFQRRNRAVNKDSLGLPRYNFTCSTEAEGRRLYDAMQYAIAHGGLVISGAKSLMRVGGFSDPDAAHFSLNTTNLSVYVSQAFYDVESAADVGLYAAGTGSAIAAGASDLLGFINGNRLTIPSGSESIEGGVLSFLPNMTNVNGFMAFSLIPCTITWKSGYSAPGLYRGYYGDSANIVTDGSDPGNYDAYDSSLKPVSPTKFTVWADLQATGGYQLSRLPFAVSVGPLDWSPDEIVVDLKMRMVLKNSTTMDPGWVLYKLPFVDSAIAESRHIPPSGTVDTYSFSPRGPGYFDAKLAFTSIDSLNGFCNYTANFPYSFAGSFFVNLQVLAVTVYGQTNLAFGSNSAVVTPGAGPLDAPEGTYPARQTGGVTLPEAAACILSANGWFPQNPGNYPVGTVPTWNAPASAVGEYIDPAKSFIEAAELLAQESWAIFALEQNAIGTADELPDPPRLQLGQDTDVITEPTIEYQLFGGKYLGKAYIANVDLPFDSTNASAFYGGWGLAPAGAEEAEGTDYGYLIWQRCRAAFLAHGIKRGQTYQFNGIHDAQTMGRMWWEAKRNGFRRIDWLAFHPRYMTFSVKRFNSFGWAGSSTRLPQNMAGGAGYDVTAWGPLYNDAVTVVAVAADPMTGITEFSVALPPVVTDGHDIGLTVDTLNNTLDLSTDTLDSGLSLTTDTLEA